MVALVPKFGFDAWKSRHFSMMQLEDFVMRSTETICLYEQKRKNRKLYFRLEILIYLPKKNYFED